MIEDSKRCLFGGMIPATKTSPKPALAKPTKTEPVKMIKIVPKKVGKLTKSVKQISNIKISEKFESPIKRVDSIKQVNCAFVISYHGFYFSFQRVLLGQGTEEPKGFFENSRCFLRKHF